MRVCETIEKLIEPKINELGFKLYDIEYAKEAEGFVLTVFIDKDGGINIDDCELVSRAVDPLLDEADPISDAYFLCVSSVGLDRPIKKDKDFLRNIGNKVDLKLYVPVDKKKQFVGTLIAFDDETFTLEIQNKPMQFKRKDAALLRMHIDF